VYKLGDSFWVGGCAVASAEKYPVAASQVESDPCVVPGPCFTEDTWVLREKASKMTGGEDWELFGTLTVKPELHGMWPTGEPWPWIHVLHCRFSRFKGGG